MSKRCNTQAIFLRKDVAREDFGMVAGPPPKRQDNGFGGGGGGSGMRGWGGADVYEESWGGSGWGKGKGKKGKGKGKGKSWDDWDDRYDDRWDDRWDDRYDDRWDGRGDDYDDGSYGKGKKGKGKGWGKGKDGGKWGKGKGGKGKSNNSMSYSMHDERGDDRDRRSRSPRRNTNGGFGGRWKHDMFGAKDDGDDFRNFGGRGPVRKGKGKGKGKGKSKDKPADPKQLDQELSKYFGKEPDGLEKENLDTELESYMGKEGEKKETKEATEAKEKPAEK